MRHPISYELSYNIKTHLKKFYGCPHTKYICYNPFKYLNRFGAQNADNRRDD